MPSFAPLCPLWQQTKRTFGLLTGIPGTSWRGSSIAGSRDLKRATAPADHAGSCDPAGLAGPPTPDKRNYQAYAEAGGVRWCLHVAGTQPPVAGRVGWRTGPAIPTWGMTCPSDGPGSGGGSPPPSSSGPSSSPLLHGLQASQRMFGQCSPRTGTHAIGVSQRQQCMAAGYPTAAWPQPET